MIWGYFITANFMYVAINWGWGMGIEYNNTAEPIGPNPTFLEIDGGGGISFSFT